MTPGRKRTQKRKGKQVEEAVAVFRTSEVEGDVVARPCASTGGKGKGKGKGIDLVATFTRFPKGVHGFHIHKAGDMRQKDCSGLCEHYDQGRRPHRHGSYRSQERHTGDLGNLTRGRAQTRGRTQTKTLKRRYCLPTTRVQDLWGRSIIVHAGPDDLGKGGHEDSLTTGHSGARMACAVFGRA